MRKRTSLALTGEIQLPEVLIQRIQSFLDDKKAAQTTVISKSWYNSWLTRSNLAFDERHFKNCDSNRFPKFLKKTMQRYQDLNLKIDSFKLWVKSLENVGYSLPNELIIQAIKMGATDINFGISSEDLSFVLPPEVLESESLIRLSVTGCKIKGVKVCCSRLKYLHFGQVLLEGDLFSDVILSCPLIEDLELRQCQYLISKKKRMLALSRVDGPITLFEMHKLKLLFLDKVRICSLFFSDFSSKFPCLKDLSVHKCFGYKEIQIYSESLEFISVLHTEKKSLKAYFDVPILRKFCFSSAICLPSLSFPSSCNWESDVSILNPDISRKWFLNLNKLLTSLSLSKVSLFLESFRMMDMDYCSNTRCLPKPLVENLTIGRLSAGFPAFFDNLFRCCRPVFVTQYWHPSSSFSGNILDIIYKRLMEQKCGLEEVSVSVFDESVSVWRMLPWKSFLDASTSYVGEQRIRFHLRWRQESATFT